MSTPANRPIWEQHPLWLDRERLERITHRMWLQIQKVMFPGLPRRSMPRPGRTELTVVGGTSVEDVFNEALQALLMYEPPAAVNWDAVGMTIAHRKAVDAVREATKGRILPDGSELDISSLYAENQKGERPVEKLADPRDTPDEEATDRILRHDRLLAFRIVAEEALPQRDREIVFRLTRGDTKAAIARDLGLTGPGVAHIYSRSLRAIHAGLRRDPTFRRLYDPEGGDPHG